MEGFWNWFIGDGGAAWITAIIAIIAYIYAYVKRTKAPVVVIQEIEQQELLSIHPSQKEKLKVSYNDQLGQEHIVQNLLQKKFVIYNLGTQDILDNINVSLRATNDPSQSKNSLFEIIFDNDECKYEKTTDGQSENLIASIKIPYLNAYQPHKHYHSAYVLSDTNIDISLQSGMGKGWSSRLISADNAKIVFSKYEKIMKIFQIGFSALAALLALILSVFTPQLTITFDKSGNIQPMLEYRFLFGTIGTPLNSSVPLELLNNPLVKTPLAILLVMLLGMLVFVLFKEQIIYKFYLMCLPPSKFRNPEVSE